MIKATELLESNPNPSVAQIKEAFTTSGPSPHLCRCGSYTRNHRGRQRAATIMAKEEVSDDYHAAKSTV